MKNHNERPGKGVLFTVALLLTETLKKGSGSSLQGGVSLLQ